MSLTTMVYQLGCFHMHSYGTSLGQGYTELMLGKYILIQLSKKNAEIVYCSFLHNFDIPLHRTDISLEEITSVLASKT